MTTFTVTTASAEAISAPLDDVWAAMVDPNLLAALTPLIDGIEASGEHWCWRLVTIGALGVEVAPRFTVRMAFDEPNRITFTHDPPPGKREVAGATGHYDMAAIPDGTLLDIELSMTVDLPLPALSRGAVERVMGRTTQAAGDRFFHNLLTYLGARRIEAPAATGAGGAAGT